MLTGRDGIGIEISYDIKTLALERLMNTDIEMANEFINRRIINMRKTLLIICIVFIRIKVFTAIKKIVIIKQTRRTHVA